MYNDPLLYKHVFSNFNCCGGGNFRNFTEDTPQTSNYIAPSDKDGTGIEVSLSDVTRFAVGNIVEMQGDVYNGNFEVSRVWKRSGDNGGTIFLKTKFLFTSPTAVKDAAWANGYVDKSVHQVKNISMFSPLVLQYAELIRNTKGKDAGGKDDKIFDDGNWLQIWKYPSRAWDLVAGGDGILQVAYRKLKSGGSKGTYSVAEMNYLRSAADAAISTIGSKSTRNRAKDFMNNKFIKLQDSSILMPSTTINELGNPTVPAPTQNESPVAQAGRGSSGGNGTSGAGASGAGASISGSNMTKYLFLAVAAVGGFFLIRSIVKK